MAIPQHNRTYWSGLAEAYHSLLDSPLRPVEEDIRTMQDVVAAWQRQHPGTRLRALLLGVTPAIANMEWPAESFLLSIDSSMSMIGSVWPENVPERRSAACGNWKVLPAHSSSFHVVIGDGSFSSVRYPGDLAAVVSEVHRVLEHGGILVHRCFNRPAKPDNPAGVMEDALRGAIPSFHVFKLRMLMAMQQSVEAGTAVDNLYRYWSSWNIGVEDFAERTGWPVSLIRSLELYRGTNTVVVFPTLPQLRDALAPFFDEISLTFPSYPLAERCPILVAEARCTR